MYTMEDLFDKREVFAARLEQIMEEKSYTKFRLCKEAQISRPTLDKILDCSITNEVTFLKHASKIMAYLNITPDAILGTVCYPYNRFRKLKKIINITNDKISEETGIPVDRLKDIEAGKDAELSELRDIAFCCHTSVRAVTGTYYFYQPLSHYYILGSDNELSGFWGHVGILLSARREYVWYPVTSKVREYIENSMDNEYMVIPCMNNKLLLLNMAEIDHIVLLNDACDPPEFCNWNTDVSEGEIPLVVYEILTEGGSDLAYMLEEGMISQQLYDWLEHYLEEKELDDNQTLSMTKEVNIYYKRGNTLSTVAEFYEDSSMVEVISNCYEMGRLEEGSTRMLLEDLGGAEIFVNLENIAMMEMPLVAVEEPICETYSIN